MRRIFALGCCALYLMFGFVAGAAHVHDSAEHHEDPQGLHLNHVHLSDSGGPDHGHGSLNECDVLYLGAEAIRPLKLSVQPVPAIATTSAANDSVQVLFFHDEAMPQLTGDPPCRKRIRPRAPPV